MLEFVKNDTLLALKIIANVYCVIDISGKGYHA
jgi:hypothetical protein